MNTTQIEKQIIQNSRGLPAEVLQEILDFIQFLKLKKSGVINDSIQTTLSELDSSEIKHLEEEFIDYKIVYPHE